MSKDEQAFWDACVASAAGSISEEIVIETDSFGDKRVNRHFFSAEEIAKRADELLEERRKRYPRGLRMSTEDKIWGFLQQPASVERFAVGGWVFFGSGLLFDMIAIGMNSGKCRVVLSDGTIFREW